MEGPNGATAHSVAHFSIRESYLTPPLVGCSGGGLTVDASASSLRLSLAPAA
jgi:hypothetical protein